MSDKIKIHEDYTIEIGGVCIEYLSREDLEKLRDALNKILGDDKIDLSKITFPSIPAPQWPQQPSIGDGPWQWGPTITWTGSDGRMWETLNEIKIYENDSSNAQGASSSSSAQLQLGF